MPSHSARPPSLPGRGARLSPLACLSTLLRPGVPEFFRIFTFLTGALNCCRHGHRTKIGQGGRIIWACTSENSPPERFFPHPGHDFCPTLGILFSIFLFISSGWPILQEGTSPPREAQPGELPPPPPQYAYGCRASLKVPRGFPDFFRIFTYLTHRSLSRKNCLGVYI